MATMTAAIPPNEPPVQALARRAESWPDLARVLIVSDQKTLGEASGCLQGIKGLRAEIASTFEPIISKAFAAHKEAVAQRKKVEAPLEEAERIIKGSVGSYMAEQERIRQAEERRLREEAERIAAEQMEQQIAAAEASGASVAEVQAIIEQPIFIPQPVAQPTFEKIHGISTRETWRAEVTDKAALIRAAAINPQLQGLLDVNMTALNGMARALKSALSIPGVRVYADAGVSVRRS